MSKRTREEEDGLDFDTYDWSVTFIDMQAVKHVWDATAAALSQVVMKLAPEGDPADNIYYLSVNGMDMGKNCFAQAKIEVRDVVFKTGMREVEFSVDPKELSVHCDIDNLAGCESVMRGSGSTIMLRFRPWDKSAQEFSSVQESGCEINTRDDEAESLDLLNFEFDWQIGIHVPTLRNLIKNARRLQAERIRFQVYSYNLKSDMEVVKLKISAPKSDGKPLYTSSMHGVKTFEDGSKELVPVENICKFDDSQRTLCVDNLYMLDKIENFLKHVPSSNQLKCNMKQNLPIRMQSVVDGSTEESSFLRFYIAALNNDCD